MTHVLFVDDDERVLRGIRRTMRTTHPDWQMSFAPNGEAALEHLDTEGADVIVSDAQMPGVDGLALLQLVRMRHPETARIMLTGQVKKDQTYEAVGLVHQFLAKPCPPEELQAAIDRALHLRNLLDDPTLRSVVARMRALPSQPDVYTRLMRAVRSEEVGMEDIAAIVEENPSVAARVLQLVNSAFFGLPRPTASIKEAVVFIGTKTLRTLVLSVEAFRDLELDAEANGLDPSSLQEHAVTTARIAADMVPAAEREAAYSAGLLHSIGVLVIASQLPGDWQRIIEEARAQQRALLEVEKLVLGVDHGQVAAALLSLWGLPHDVIEAVAQHLHPSPVSGFGGHLVAVTHVASRLADEISPPYLADIPGTPIDHEYLAVDGSAESLDDWRYLAEQIADEAG
ncbi:MAG: response regulator [Acidimicrobiia bacterium]|nr:response regulator [Acidimicrobiia bacterium]